MSSFLDQYRERAEVYYSSPEYKDQLGELEEIMKINAETISGLNLAFDLEGVLISNRISGVQIEDRLRRPFGREIIEMLARHGGNVSVWTAAGGGYIVPDMMDFAKLNLHPNTRVTTRHDYIAKLCEKENSWIKNMIACIPRQRIDRDESGILEMITSYRAKFCSVMGVNYLFDDKAEEHSAACHTMGFASDKDRVLKVEPFDLDRWSLDMHFLDTGLLTALKKAPFIV
ncbi:MAG: hypothetical protein PHP74_00275 [Candidatus Gracilibacteria bacterium]|nr:hypothetical protein [Candidatus Gracilibacteria bacterium]